MSYDCLIHQYVDQILYLGEILVFENWTYIEYFSMPRKLRSFINSCNFVWSISPILEKVIDVSKYRGRRNAGSSRKFDAGVASKTQRRRINLLRRCAGVACKIGRFYHQRKFLRRVNYVRFVWGKRGSIEQANAESP